MAKCSLFTLQLLFGLSWLCHLQVTLTTHASVRPGENITLLCNITDYPEISWYKLRADEVNLLIYAEKGRVKKKYLLSYNVNESHYDVTESSSSVSLVIIGVGETDLGFYYCGGRNDAKHIQFGKPIRLNITDDQKTQPTTNSCEPSGAGVELTITASVCVASLLMNFICLCVFCYRLKGKSASCSCFSKTSNASKKDESMHYASIQHGRRSRAAQKKSTGTESDSVLYAAVASQPRRH